MQMLPFGVWMRAKTLVDFHLENSGKAVKRSNAKPVSDSVKESLVSDPPVKTENEQELKSIYIIFIQSQWHYASFYDCHFMIQVQAIATICSIISFGNVYKLWAKHQIYLQNLHILSI